MTLERIIFLLQIIMVIEYNKETEGNIFFFLQLERKEQGKVSVNKQRQTHSFQKPKFFSTYESSVNEYSVFYHNC